MAAIIGDDCLDRVLPQQRQFNIEPQYQAALLRLAAGAEPSGADDVIETMRARCEVLRREVAEVDAKRAELARLERMIAAGAP
jgi:hypothetical protein